MADREEWNRRFSELEKSAHLYNLGQDFHKRLKALRGRVDNTLGDEMNNIKMPGRSLEWTKVAVLVGVSIPWCASADD